MLTLVEQEWGNCECGSLLLLLLRFKVKVVTCAPAPQFVTCRPARGREIFLRLVARVYTTGGWVGGKGRGKRKGGFTTRKNFGALRSAIVFFFLPSGGKPGSPGVESGF